MQSLKKVIGVDSKRKFSQRFKKWFKDRTSKKSLKGLKKGIEISGAGKKSLQKVEEPLKPEKLKKRKEFLVKKERIKSKLRSLLSSIKKSSRKLARKMIKRKDDRGVMFIDSGFVELLKEEIKGKDVRGKFIGVSFKKKETDKLGEEVSEDE